MGKEKEAIGGSLLMHELFQFGVYKRNQGRITRQLTFAGLALAVLIAGWRIADFVSEYNSPAVRYGIPAVAVIVGLWLSYRVVNISRFADFLIGVEGEMNKVSWPTRGELLRSSIVVIGTIVILATMLALYDVFWVWLLGILRITAT